jgi:thiosulfate dehydrogenase
MILPDAKLPNVARTLPAAWWTIAMVLILFGPLPGRGAAAEPATQGSVAFAVPDIDALPDDNYGRQVRKGRELVTETYARIGPLVGNPAKRYAGNNLACSNCHLEAGTKKFGLPIFGIYGEFPRYSARTGREMTLEDRIDSCMVRSMNGKPLPADSPEMRAFVAYVRFLSSGVARGEQVSGLGSGKVPELDRAADPERGKAVYVRACLGCHNSGGAGIARSPADLALGYAVPPLWGNDSFNDGAGMARLINLADFLHSNMPHGADYLDPILSVEEAWDVAAFVEKQPRPHKAGLERDFPDLLEKPVDTPYGPYADSFSAAQHKYGPFAPIRAALAELKAAK